MIEIAKALENICKNVYDCPFDDCPFDDKKKCDEETWQDWLGVLQKRKAPAIVPAKCCNNCEYYTPMKCTLRNDTFTTITSYCEAFSEKIVPMANGEEGKD